jgi:adenylosuccinate synthase
VAQTAIPAPGSHNSAPVSPAKAAGGATAVVGLQWGDEGKGKLVDLLAGDHDAVVRYNGGANAGHSVVVKGERYALHLVPSGILYPGKLSVIGNGVVVDPDKLLEEIEGLERRGVDTSGLVVSDRAHVVMPYHKREDVLREEALQAGKAARGGGNEGHGELGTTKRGIGPCYAEKVQRSTAIRMGDLLRPAALREKLATACAFKSSMLSGMSGQPEALDPEALAAAALAQGQKLAPRIKDTFYLLHGLLAQGKRILFEGANAALLDVDHGTYPYVTSSSTTVLGIGSGTGIPERRLDRVLGVMKAYTTRVGRGPMPTELHDEIGNRIRERGREYGTTTGRPRRVGRLDLVAVKYSAMLNGATGMVVTMLDVLAGMGDLPVCTAYRPDGARGAGSGDVGGETDKFLPDAADLSRVQPVYTVLPGFGEEITGARKWSDLPTSARRYIDFIEERVGVPVDVVGVGPDREQTIMR